MTTHIPPALAARIRELEELRQVHQTTLLQINAKLEAFAEAIEHYRVEAEAEISENMPLGLGIIASQIERKPRAPRRDVRGMVLDWLRSTGPFGSRQALAWEIAAELKLRPKQVEDALKHWEALGIAVQLTSGIWKAIGTASPDAPAEAVEPIAAE